MDSFLADVGYALRGFRRSPGFAAVALLTLALGVSATTAIYTVVDSVLLRALPFAQPSRLVSIDRVWPTRAVLVRTRATNRSLSAVSAYGYPQDVIVSGRGEPLRLAGSSVSADLFSTLGVGSTIGRTFLPGEDQSGKDHVVVLSHAFWQQRFGGDERVLGTSLRIDGVERTIVGVMPVEFRFPAARVAFWYPMILDPGDTSQAYWGEGGYFAIGRLASGVTLAQARGDLRNVAKRMRPEFPWHLAPAYGDSAGATPLQNYLVSSMRPMLALMLGAVALMLLVACVNIANLLLARTATRQREIAIRTSVGASKLRLVRQLLTESLTLAVVGGALGVIGAVWGTRALVGLLPADTPRLSEVHMDLRVLAVAAGLIIATGFAFGLAPAIRATQRPGTRAGRGSRWLVSAQVALAVVLVAAAGLLAKSFWKLRLVDPGFATQQLLTATVPLPPVVNDTVRHADLFQKAVLESVRQIPGVQSAATASRLPLDPSAGGTVIQTEAHPLPADAFPPHVNYDFVSPDYFKTMGIPLREGRAFTDADRADSGLGVAIIDQTAARTLWPGENPIGQRARHSWMNDWFTVVGVVANVRHDSLSGTPEPTIYRPMAGHMFGLEGEVSLALRVSGDPALVAQHLRAAVAAVDPQVPVTDIATGSGLVSHSLARPRLTTQLLGIFAAVALLLGAIGVYGVMSHVVAQRSREIGIRMALGARADMVLWMTVRQGLTLVALGVGVGILGALASTRILRAMLYGVSPTDPLLFAAVPCVFAIVAVIASWAPARRAASVNPIIAIRSE